MELAKLHFLKLLNMFLLAETRINKVSMYQLIEIQLWFSSIYQQLLWFYASLRLISVRVAPSQVTGHHSTGVTGVCTCFQTLRCEGSSQRSSGTRSPPAPYSAGCLSWGRRSSAPLRKARRCGSTSARPHCPGGSAFGTEASSLQEMLRQGWRGGVRTSQAVGVGDGGGV